ncbi:MAG: hypothetical protein VXZ12_11170, partial [SAR324 cluster bacterium]|nr:hypothetical protein [SAR324 cluster bacterium]
IGRIQFCSTGIFPFNRQGIVANLFRKVNFSGFDEAHQYKIAIPSSGPYGKLEMKNPRWI